MLCLSRKKNEKLVLIDKENGRRIEVILIHVKPDKVRLGIVAPREVEVWREELLTKRH